MRMEPGSVVGERYQLDRILGEGGMGTVWAATHTVTRKAVALKFLHPEQSADPTIRQRFLREARAACAVRHPNVVAVHDVFETEDGAPLMVMDLLLGETLASKLAREGPLPLPEVVRIMAPVISAVATAHTLGIVHRDLKPENIFLAVGPDKNGVEVKVLDFGIAKLTSFEGLAANTSALTADGGMLGTPFYMSPEQVDGERDIDHRSDIWALGIILYQCLSGTMPTNGENLGQVFKIITRGTIAPLSDVVPGLPRDVSNLVSRMMSRERSGRPQSLEEVALALGAPASIPVALPSDPQVRILRMSDSPRSPMAISLGDSATIAVKTNSGISRTLPPRRRSGPLVAIAGLAIAGVAAASWFAFVRARPGPDPARTTVVSPAGQVASAPAPSQASLATAPSAGTPADLPVALSAATAAAPAPSAAPIPTHVARPRPQHPGAAIAPPSAAPASPDVDRPGGVYEKAPF
jgi:serine/threonine protein kinase